MYSSEFLQFHAVSAFGHFTFSTNGHCNYASFSAFLYPFLVFREERCVCVKVFTIVFSIFGKVTDDVSYTTFRLTPFVISAWVIFVNTNALFEQTLTSFKSFLRVISRRTLPVTFNDLDFPRLAG